MLRIVFVRTGTKYGPEYVERLRDMVCRNLAADTPGQFECITDQPEEWPGIVNRPSEGLGGWWDKMALFKPGAWPDGERIWYFDLDTLITGPLDEIIKYDGPFAALADFLRPGELQSAVMTWRAGECDDIWRRWLAEDQPRMAGGDQSFIWRCKPQFIRLQAKFPHRFQSYKLKCRYGIPPGTSVVCFHGEPRPHQVNEGWVTAVWKVGGGTAHELVVIGNTPYDDLVANIAHACGLSKPWLEKQPALPEGEDTCLIIGGGPSINTQLPVIQSMAGQHEVIALNAAAFWCSYNGVLTDYHVMLDARPEMAAMIPAVPQRIYASQCCPDVTDRADILWHAHVDGFDPCQYGGADFAIGGGCSVGMVAMSIAYTLGFRKFHLFGYDSCGGHAYSQPLNNRDGQLEVSLEDGSTWLAAPWMVQQVKDYQALAPLLTDMGCEITVHGEGLLPSIHLAMCNSAAAVDLRAGAILQRLNGAENVRGVEVGTFAGDLAHRLLAGKDTLTLTMVDPYAAAVEASPWSETGDFHAHMTQDEHDACFAKASERLAVFADRAVLLRMPSTTAAPLFEDGSQDFVFIDGDHSYEGVCADLTAWAPKVRIGGWLCGHDYKNTQVPFPGVERAVDEYAEAIGLPVELGDNFTWFIRR